MLLCYFLLHVSPNEPQSVHFFYLRFILLCYSLFCLSIISLKKRITNVMDEFYVCTCVCVRLSEKHKSIIEGDSEEIQQHQNK